MVMEIKFNNVSCDYQFGPVRTPRVLHQIALTIPIRSFTAIIGHTGAGKSSLLKTMNGLLLPKEGSVTIGDMIIEQNTDKNIKKVHKKSGWFYNFLSPNFCGNGGKRYLFWAIKLWDRMGKCKNGCQTSDS